MAIKRRTRATQYEVAPIQPHVNNEEGFEFMDEGINNDAPARLSRATEKRSYESRVTESRAPITFSEGSGFNVPAHIRESDPNHSYAYIPYICAGKELEHEYSDAIFNRGFQPVKATDHPSLSRRYHMSPFAERKDDDLIKMGGQVLMKRPLEYKQAEDRVFDEKIARDNYIRKMHSQNANDPRLFIDDRSYNPGRN